ncbi:hypothetical protein DFP78_11190 [Photobacterium lutimaris]|nr:hypothetical protein DFP78_11190 [Photobacterium lutimaris]
MVIASVFDVFNKWFLLVFDLVWGFYFGCICWFSDTQAKDYGVFHYLVAY